MKYKILLDIGHPAHVHYFRNFISIMEEKGHKFKVIARDKEVTHNLLKNYSIEFCSRGRGSNNLFGKLFYLLRGTKHVYCLAKEFQPDFLLSFASPYTAIASKLLGIPNITLDDTDHASLSHKIYSPLSDVILNPEGFKVSFNKSKQIYFNGFTELMYLHPNYFSPLKDVSGIINIEKNQPYVILRFVSWSANHDINAVGLSVDDKLKLVESISSKFKVFISSESELPENLKKYQIKVPVHKIHDVLKNAALFVGESGTMSSECAMLGVPNIQIRHTLERDKVPGVHLKLEERGLKILKHSKDISGIIASANHILDHYDEVKVQYQQKKDKMISEVDDLNDILIDMIVGYPESIKKYSEH